jgi:hypothetical protein
VLECVNGVQICGAPVHKGFDVLYDKYSKLCIVYELRECLRKKSIKLSALEQLFAKFSGNHLPDSEPELSGMVGLWRRTRELWFRAKSGLEACIAQLHDIDGLTTQLKLIQEAIQCLKGLPFEIADRTEEVPELGSVSKLELMETWLITLITLHTESQLPKNPLSIAKVPELLSKDNPLVR